MTAASVVADLAPTGSLRVSINLGNPVLAQGTPDRPSGVTVDIASELAARMAVPVSFTCFMAARDSYQCMAGGLADVCFLAIDPVRQETVAFTGPYALIEGTYVVPEASPAWSVADLDQSDVRIGVKEGSAYDLHLSRTLQHAQLIRGSEGTTVFADQQLEAGAGIRQPVAEFVLAHEGLRVLEPAFIQIEQALGAPRSRSARTHSFLWHFIENLKASGFVADALDRSGRRDATVAPLLRNAGVQDGR